MSLFLTSVWFNVCLLVLALSNKPFGLYEDWLMSACGLYFGVASSINVCETSKGYL